MSLERFAEMAERDGDTDQRGDPLVPPELVACIQRIVTEAMNAHSAGLALAPTGGGAGTAPPTGSGTGTAPPTGGGSGDGTGRCQSFLLAAWYSHLVGPQCCLPIPFTPVFSSSFFL